MTHTQKFTAQNQAAWDEIADIRYQKMAQKPAFFAAGGITLDARVLNTVGYVNGLAVIHLQCATGEDTLSWAVLGAQAVGVDISPRQIELAQQAAQEAGLQAAFYAADIYALPPVLQTAQFDVVFTGGGAIVWLPDLTAWAQVIFRALKPGGRLVMLESHPFAGILEFKEGALRVAFNYFGRATPDEGPGWYHFDDEGQGKANKYEFSWPLGDVVTALAQAGLVIFELAEYPSKETWRFGEMLDAVQGLPGEYLLVAEKP